MKKILLLVVTLLFSTISVANAATDARVQQAQNWLDSLKIAKARFEQIDYQGNVMRGTFYINRPGRLRFEYDAPIKDYIVADGVQIHFYDGESGQTNSAPIGSTLADFILRDGRRFEKDVKVESVTEKGDMVNIAVTQANEPGMGQLILNFSKSPFELKSWQIIDAQGLTTTLVLHDFDRNATVPPSLFRMKNRNLNN